MAMNTQSRPALRWALILITVAGLAIDAIVHFHLASGTRIVDGLQVNYSEVRNSANSISQGDLFRIEAIVSVVVAVALLLRPRRYTAALAFIVSLAGFAAVVVYRYVDLGKLGPFPPMHEPFWYTEKTLSAIAEGVAAVTALVLFLVLHADARHASGATARPHGGNAVQATG